MKTESLVILGRIARAATMVLLLVASMIVSRVTDSLIMIGLAAVLAGQTDRGGADGEGTRSGSAG